MKASNTHHSRFSHSYGLRAGNDRNRLMPRWHRCEIQAATEVGVLYPQYNELLIEAQAGVNNAENILPDGSVKTELRLTMDSYIDAGIVWQERLRNGDEYYLTSDLEPGKSLMKKYTLVTFKMQNRMAANPDKALQAIWSHAKTRLEKLKELLPPQ